MPHWQNLGGVYAKTARQLITQKYQEEYKTLCREQDLSLAKAESYYNKRLVEMIKEQNTGNEIKKKLEGKTTQSTERQKWYYLVPERNETLRHIYWAGQVKEFKKKMFKQLLWSHSETTVPKFVS